MNAKEESMPLLRTALADWTDFDIASHALAQCLGLVPPDMAMHEVKSMYWSNNDVGKALHQMLETLALAHIIERRDEPDLQFRWHQPSE